ncbi:hypothetical protein LZP81_30885 [Streptomyces parvulus]|uniref:hypothetical protein n=1 Tax=Streptomyces parvulus TaxID=146923 RepID=UPI001E2A8597|nr:hypothetical protein [Streptomyces parvulus]MCC9154888.1 hypothetical protein [Streptomyces parvulus]MCE7691267.1 hypothetical protein [Streptomyces parvulus]
MTRKDRPWHRNPDPEPTPEPEPEQEPSPTLLPGMAGLQIGDMDDEAVRLYCLSWARMHLTRYDLMRHLDDTELEKAARYAQIAQAFRPSPPIT